MRRSRCSSPTTSVVLLTSGDPRRRTGGNLYDARVVRAARRAGVRVAVRSVRTPAGAARTLAARADLVVIDSIAFGIAADAMRAAGDTPLVALVHMHVRGPASRTVLRRADAVVTVSRSLARELRALGARHVRVIPPGADGTPLGSRPGPRDALRVLCVANWSAAKGVDVLIRAWRDPDGARLELAGEEGHGAYARRLRQLLRGARHISRHGAVGAGTLARLYARADVVVVPSRTEGYGIVAAEALVRGIPVIASDLPSLRAIVGRAGALVRPGDVRALGRAIADARDARRRQRWIAAARARASRLPRWRDTERAFVSLLVAEMHQSRDGGDGMPPRGVKSPKRKRQYEKIKKSVMKRGRSAKTAKRIAAATTNKTRRRKGETKKKS